MPKQKGRNAFYFFMLDWKKRAEAKGETFPNGLKDVQADPDCNEEWKNLTKQQKGPYEAMAKSDKFQVSSSTADKKTTFGESIKLLEEKEKQEQQFIIDMQENIKFTIDMAVKINILPKMKFCFMHVNWFFSKIVNNNVDYFPAEYALGVFSLENGIEAVHHVIVSSKIPLGYRREAMEMSQNGHQIPVEHAGGETDFTVMYAKLISFLEPRKLVDKYPPIYVTKTCTRPVRSLLDCLSDAAGKDREEFKVYELESLFAHIANEAYKKRTDREMKFIPAYAFHVFTRLTYIFEKGFECSFHKYVDRGSEFCSKSILQQWAWMMCDEFCVPLEVEMQPGVHYPIKSDINLSSLTHTMNNLQMENNYQSESENTILSMTGVSEQHKLKVSSRTYQDEVQRRYKSRPIEIIDHSEKDETTTGGLADISDKSLDISIDEQKRRRNLMQYLNEKQMQSSDAESCVASDFATVEALIPKDFEHFPPIGGRGVSCRTNRTTTKKAPLGRGQGYA